MFHLKKTSIIVYALLCVPSFLYPTLATASTNSALSLATKQHQIQQTSLITQAKRIQSNLALGHYAKLTPDIHPTKGVRFSMYAYVDPKQDKVFTQSDYAKYLKQSKIKFTWGERDGTGERLVTPLPNYLTTWVKARDFNHASFAINRSQKSGNMINNLKTVYPNQEFVEFYYRGTANYDYMDWRVLRLVFENYQGKRYLVGVINDCWTI